MKGFRNTTKIVAGHRHVPASQFNTFGRQSFAHGGHVSHLPHGEGGVEDFHPDTSGHSSVQRQVPSTELEAEHGGKSELTPGYKKGGEAHHFHVHKHYHSGGKIKSKSKSYRNLEKEAEKHATGGTIDKKACGGMATGGTRDKMKKGGMHINPAHKGKFTKKMTGSKKGHLTGSDVQRGLHSKSGETRKEANFARMAKRHFKPLAKGGHVIDSTHEVSPDYATGGTIDKMGAGGALYSKGGRR